ncbi:MAG: hypothetical protein ACI38Q_07810 [Candidatus Bruticola sp.]
MTRRVFWRIDFCLCEWGLGNNLRHEFSQIHKGRLLYNMYLDSECISTEEIYGVCLVPPDEWY